PRLQKGSRSPPSLPFALVKEQDSTRRSRRYALPLGSSGDGSFYGGFVLQRHDHCTTQLFHGCGSYFACPRGTVLKDIPSQSRILLVFSPPLLHGIQNAHQRRSGPGLSLNAANA